jgi:hypothetical protein
MVDFIHHHHAKETAEEEARANEISDEQDEAALAALGIDAVRHDSTPTLGLS